MNSGDETVDTTGGTSRREFLKVLGAAGAGAAAVSCGPPDAGDKLIPYLIPPADIIPGTNVTYATVLVAAGPEPLGVHARVRDGRVIKLEGNPDLPNRGRLSALAQSALQDLYDPDRLPGPRQRTGDALLEATWDEAVAAAARAVGGARTVLLTGPATGTAARFHAEWAAAVGAEWIAHEPLGLEALRTASEIAFAREEIPTYALEAADRIVCFGADFLGTWLAPVELAARFAESRFGRQNGQAKLTFVGPRLPLSGLKADEWISTPPGGESLVALALAHEVARRRGGGPAERVEATLAAFTPDSVAGMTGVPAQRIEELARSIAAARAPVALPPDHASQGEAATDAHLAVALLNYVSGAIGRTVRYDGRTVRGGAASYGEMVGLIRRMQAGEIGTLIVAGVNPAYTMPEASGFREALARVPHVVSLNPHLDETAASATWILPAHHELEAWGDADVGGGFRALAQPVMRPVFDTRQREDILLQIAALAGTPVGDAEDYRGYLRSAWQELHRSAPPGAGPFEPWWSSALGAGGAVVSDAPMPDPAPPLTAAAANHVFTAPAPSEGLALVTYPTVQLYDGRGANRSWMQEFPDPVTKAVWTSWVEIHPDTAGPLGVESGDLVELRTEAGRVTAPAYLYRGIRPDTIAVPLGQGHTAYGRSAQGRGVNALDLLTGVSDPRSGSLAFSGAAVTLSATGRRGRLVLMQGSDVDLDREIAELVTLDKARDAAQEHHVDLTALVEAAYDADPQSPYRWGMTIDLNACTGCGACVTACSAENNLPTVGEDLCAQGREMSWMQVMRYYEEAVDGFQTAHVPVLCQQCGDAPCEPVCPVYAAYHTPEGLNGQVYNRCVGTRYCANNCPYKVRRFNWFTYEYPYPLNLQLNPDVTVRSKGVMEKCTFCVQRINRAKLDAKSAGRLVADGEVVTACMQSCPTQAITFGNLKDPASAVSRIAKGERAYHVLGELNTRPAVTYLKGVTHAALASDEHGHGGGDTEHEAGGHS